MPRPSSTEARVDLPPIEAYRRTAGYEAFIHIVDSMISPHARWLEWMIGRHWALRQRPTCFSLTSPRWAFCAVLGARLAGGGRRHGLLAKAVYVAGGTYDLINLVGCSTTPSSRASLSAAWR